MTILPKLDLCRNQVLCTLPKAESDRLLTQMDLVSVKLGDVLQRSGGPLRYAYFPLDAVISCLTTLEDGRSVESGMKGSEGVLGLEAVLGGETSSCFAVVRIPGDCIKIRTEVLQAEFGRGGVLQQRMLRYLRYYLFQIAQFAACNRVHLLEQRLCRSLLLAHNPGWEIEYPITHEFLSGIIGAARTEVSNALQRLRDAGLIAYRRGKIGILNQKKLESAACECYQIVSSELSQYRRESFGFSRSSFAAPPTLPTYPQRSLRTDALVPFAGCC